MFLSDVGETGWGFSNCTKRTQKWTVVSVNQRVCSQNNLFFNIANCRKGLLRRKRPKPRRSSSRRTLQKWNVPSLPHSHTHAHHRHTERGLHVAPPPPPALCRPRSKQFLPAVGVRCRRPLLAARGSRRRPGWKGAP